MNILKSKDDEMWEGQWEEQEEARKALKQLRNEIHEYADNDAEYGWFIIKSEGKYYRFPKRALMWHVFGETPPVRKLLPEYKPFSPIGLKLPNDDVYHTDTMLGAGFDISDPWSFDTDENTALYEAKRAIEKEMKNLIEFDFTILANGLELPRWGSYKCRIYEHAPKDFRGTSTSHIEDQKTPKSVEDELRAICIPHAGIKYDLVARQADIIITEVGGPLAHLATISRELGKLLIRVDGACEKFPYFTRLYVDVEELKLKPIVR